MVTVVPTTLPALAGVSPKAIVAATRAATAMANHRSRFLTIFGDAASAGCCFLQLSWLVDFMVSPLMFFRFALLSINISCLLRRQPQTRIRRSQAFIPERIFNLVSVRRRGRSGSHIESLETSPKDLQIFSGGSWASKSTIFSSVTEHRSAHGNQRTPRRFRS